MTLNAFNQRSLRDAISFNLTIMLVPVCLSIVEKRKTGEHLAAKVVSRIIPASERADRLDIWWGPIEVPSYDGKIKLVPLMGDWEKAGLGTACCLTL